MSRDDPLRLLRRLARGLEKREPLHSGAAREGLDDHLLDLVEQLRAQVQQTTFDETDGAPPRPIALPLAEAIYSQPHLDATFSDLAVAATGDLRPPKLAPPDDPLVVAGDPLRAMLGLEEWELDDLRDEVDRRVGFALKQQRAVGWLWSHFGLDDSDPEALFRVLFPAAGLGTGRVDFVRYGGRLYAVLDQVPPPPTSSLYLTWLDFDAERTYAPLGTFDSRYVDEALRKTLARAIGADDAELLQLLDGMIAVVPRRQLAAFIRHDRWRIRGLAAMTGLGDARVRRARLVRTLAPNDLYVKDLFDARDGELVAKDVLVTFDKHAEDRAARMLRQLWAEMLARISDEPRQGTTRPLLEDLSLYDLKQHLARVLQPLLDWAADDDTAAHVARILKVEERKAREAMKEVARRWTDRAEKHWWGAPSPHQPHTIRGALLMQLLSTHHSLRYAWQRELRGHVMHRDLLLLFAGHWFADVPLGEVVREHRAPVARTDPIAGWFWGTFRRILAEADPERTYSGPSPVPPD